MKVSIKSFSLRFDRQAVGQVPQDESLGQKKGPRKECRARFSSQSCELGQL
jgi:hypothetical protein